MKGIKKAVVLALSMMMVLTMGFSSFAGSLPKDTDKATITVTNVDSGATVKAYKIAKANYTADGLTGYEAVSGVTIKNLEHPTEEEIAAIVADVANLGTAIDMSESQTAAGSYTADVEAGMYLVLVTKSGTNDAKVYNPIILSAGYDASDNTATLTGGTASAGGTFFDNGYAKSSTPTVDKKITGETKDGNTKHVGDAVGYEIETTFPSYSKAYTSVKYDVVDELSTGLTAPAAKDVKVSIGGTALTNTNGALTSGTTEVGTVTVNGQIITVSFNSAYVLANPGVKSVVSYSATLNENAKSNFDPNTNTATIKYSNDPTNPTTPVEKKDTTYTYTFGIDADLGGSSTEKTKEVTKLGEVTKDGTTTNEALKGAEFTLYSDAACKNPVKIIDAKGVIQTSGATETDENGYMEMKGLNAGKYYLKETKAPKPYKLDPTVHDVVISATLNDNGTLASYSVTIDNKVANTYSATYENEVIKTITPDSGNKTLEIINTPLPTLPSTGSIGTYLFTIAGTAIMIIAVVMMTRKKKASSDR